MTTTFNLTVDLRRGLALVADETVITDLVGLTVSRNPDGTFACTVTREGGGPVQLVPEGSTAGQQAMRANGQLSPVPGFVEVPKDAEGSKGPTTEELAKMLGWVPPADDSRTGKVTV